MNEALKLATRCPPIAHVVVRHLEVVSPADRVQLLPIVEDFGGFLVNHQFVELTESYFKQKLKIIKNLQITYLFFIDDEWMMNAYVVILKIMYKKSYITYVVLFNVFISFEKLIIFLTKCSF